MQQGRRAAMALRQLLVAARGGTAHPDIYPRKCMHRYGLHTEPSLVVEYQFVSLARLYPCGSALWRGNSVYQHRNSDDRNDVTEQEVKGAERVVGRFCHIRRNAILRASAAQCQRTPQCL